MAKMVTIKCKAPGCTKQHTVRQADVDRGWGLYCSKKCKAIAQSRRAHKAPVPLAVPKQRFRKPDAPSYPSVTYATREEMIDAYCAAHDEWLKHNPPRKEDD